MSIDNQFCTKKSVLSVLAKVHFCGAVTVVCREMYHYLFWSVEIDKLDTVLSNMLIHKEGRGIAGNS